MCIKLHYENALSFWTASFEYLMLAENVAKEIVAQGNNWIVVEDYPIDENEYNERTKWSDHCIMVPLLFNFYHGTELLVKGFLLARGFKRITHDILKLRLLFSQEYPNEKDLNLFFKKYTDISSMPLVLKEFLTFNDLEFQDLYEALRYPSDPNFSVLNNYIRLRYRGRGGIEFFRELQGDILSARIAARKLGLVLEQEAVASD
jgi:hypothetical protein